MKKFTQFMETYFVPIAVKFGSLKALVAIRDAFITILPITMAGSIAVLFNVLFRDLPKVIFPGPNVDTASDTATSIANAMDWLIQIDGNVWFGTIAMLALVFAYSIGYYIARGYDVDPFLGGIVTLASFIIVTPQSVTIAAPKEGFSQLQKDALTSLELFNADTGLANVGGISTQYLGATNLFTAMLVGFISGLIYVFLMLKKVQINLPEGVPPAVSKTFAGLIPASAAMFVTGIISYVVKALTNTSIPDFIAEWIQKPFMSLGQSLGTVCIIALFAQLFWFFGIHGLNVMSPIMEGLYTPALLENMDKVQKGLPAPNMWTRGSWDAYLWMGGSGATFGLIIAIFIFSKKAETKAVAKIAAPMGVFNINEPIIFGLPIVLNPLYFIPWIIIPQVCAVVAYTFTAWIPFAVPISFQVPWVVPPILYALLGSGFAWQNAVLAAVCLLIQFAIWAIFVIVINGIKTDGEKDEVPTPIEK